MNGCEFDKPCDADPEIARDAAVGYLVKLGYAVEKREPGRVYLKFQGSWLTSDPERHTHYLWVTSKPGALRFEFTTGIVASYWTEKDRKFAEERAEAAASAARAHGREADYRNAPHEAHAMVSCRYCGKINLVSAGECSCCGAPVTA